MLQAGPKEDHERTDEAANRVDRSAGVDETTRTEELLEASASHTADRPPTAEEEAAAEGNTLDPEVARARTGDGKDRRRGEGGGSDRLNVSIGAHRQPAVWNLSTEIAGAIALMGIEALRTAVRAKGVPLASVDP